MTAEVFEKELSSKWVTHITENTKHWTRIEASQFLNFLINRIGETAALQYLTSFPDFPKMNIQHFMQKIAAYDQINKEIITSILKQPDIPLDLFLQEKDLQKIKKMFPIIESYIGTEAAVYLISHPEATYGLLLQSGPITTKRVMNFVDTYTKKYGFITDTLENRVNYFRQFMSLPHEQRHVSMIKLINFNELREFSKLLFKTLREAEETIERETEIFKLDKAYLNKTALNLIANFRIHNLLSALFEANIKNLRETVTILEQYITPEEVASIMMNSTAIYSLNPRKLKIVIEILKKAHSNPSKENIYETKERIVKRIKEEQKKGNIESDLVKPITTIIEKMDEPPLKPVEFISYMIRQYKDNLLSAKPTQVQNVMALLENRGYVPKDKWKVILQPNRHKEIQLGLLVADSGYLEKVLNAFEKYLKKDDIIYLIIHYFAYMSMIKKDTLDRFNKLDPFTKVVDILGTHIKIKDILIGRIVELLENHPFIPEIYETLTTTNSTSDPNTMTKSLTELSILEFAPSVQKSGNSISEKPQDPSSLH